MRPSPICAPVVLKRPEVSQCLQKRVCIQSESVVQRKWSALRLAAPLCLAISLCGCFGSGTGVDQVLFEGTVTYRGQPLENGTMNFTPKDLSNSFSGPIKDGHYKVEVAKSALPASENEMLVAVTSWEEAPQMTEAGEPTTGKERIPKKYFDPRTSGLTATVSATQRTLDFDLK